MKSRDLPTARRAHSCTAVLALHCSAPRAWQLCKLSVATSTLLSLIHVPPPRGETEHHEQLVCLQTIINGGFPGGAVVENLPANAEDTGSSPGLGRSHMLWSD